MDDREQQFTLPKVLADVFDHYGAKLNWNQYGSASYSLSVAEEDGVSVATLQKRLGQTLVTEIIAAGLFELVHGTTRGFALLLTFNGSCRGVPRSWLPKGHENDVYGPELCDLHAKLTKWKPRFVSDNDNNERGVLLSSDSGTWPYPTVRFMIRSAPWRSFRTPDPFNGKLMVVCGGASQLCTVESGLAFVDGLVKLWQKLGK